RVLHHLKAFAPDPRNAIVFTGFQAGGTRGAAILGGASHVRVYGEDVPIRAQVHNIASFSAHADEAEMMAWLSGFEKPPRKTFIVHGEPDAADSLRRHIEQELSWTVHVPAYLESVELESWD
ncbi:MAG: MBL fold metallo-hydrolase, partial [Burkholderiales bacterium]|nr:MBL fold metallo-hydrolase [Burkholderiales bacterium]